MTVVKWQERVFKAFTLYAVTNLTMESTESVGKIESAYRGGADIVQLRSKVLTDAALLRIGEKTSRIAKRYRKLFVVNDRVDLAIALNADGVHLGQEDMPVAVARTIARRAGVRLRIGKSTSRISEARVAIREGADYIGVGPVYATPTKPGRVPAGLDYVRQAATHVTIPWVAIGGIDPRNVRAVLEAGATRIAAVRAVFAATDPAAAARAFKQQLER